MSKIKDVLVPDIGEFDAIEVIEVLVKSHMIGLVFGEGMSSARSSPRPR